jgi:hypothetical protein
MAKKPENDQYSAKETARRRDETIKRALEMPAKPMKEYIGKKRPQEKGQLSKKGT